MTSLAINQSNNTFITGSLDKTIKVWDLNTNRCIKTISCSGGVWGLSFSSNGEYIVGSTENGDITVYSLKAT